MSSLLEISTGNRALPFAQMPVSGIVLRSRCSDASLNQPTTGTNTKFPRPPRQSLCRDSSRRCSSTVLRANACGTSRNPAPASFKRSEFPVPVLQVGHGLCAGKAAFSKRLLDSHFHSPTSCLAFHKTDSLSVDVWSRLSGQSKYSHSSIPK